MFNNHQLFIQMRIRNSRMINGFQTFCEHHFGQGDVAEGDRTFLEETFSHLTVDELVDERADAFLGIFVERAGGCFHRVGHHQNSLLTGEWIRTWILEKLLVYIFIWMGITIINIEILGKPGAMMGGDEILDDARKVGLFCHFQAFGHVADDDLCTLQIGKLVVRIDASLIFGEEYRIAHLADVMI